MQTNEQLDLLTDVAEVVRATPPGRLHMGRWLCGTVGCAIGNWLLARRDVAMKLSPLCRDNGFEPVFGTLDGIEAVAAFFGLTDGEAALLFLPSKYRPFGNYNITPAEVADRIEAFVARRRPLVVEMKPEPAAELAEAVG